MTLTPAYGRDYKSKKALLEDFDKDLDFIILDISSRWNGMKVNKSQLIETGENQVNIRYNSLRKVAVISIHPKFT